VSGGWDGFQAAVVEARREVAGHAPDPEIAAEGEAYVMRVATAALADVCLGHLFADNGLKLALKTRGGPNPDYRIAGAPFDPERRYRIEGRLNDSERVGIGLYALGENAAPLEVGYAAFDRGNTGADGSFRLDMAAGAAGAGTLAIPPEARILITRTLHRTTGQPANVAISGGEPTPGLALVSGTTEGALGGAGQTLLSGVREYLKWTQAVVAQPNRIDIAPPELAATVQGDRDTHYYLGYYDLAEGEWLEVTLPQDLPGYWSLHAYNHWFENLETTGAHDRNTSPDNDGRIRVAIGANLPSTIANRIDTLGLKRGALICRVIGASEVSVPVARVVRACC
jgi:hypothetical protein